VQAASAKIVTGRARHIQQAVEHEQRADACGGQTGATPVLAGKYSQQLQFAHTQS
jgi:hypothetical protein